MKQETWIMHEQPVQALLLRFTGSGAENFQIGKGFRGFLINQLIYSGARRRELSVFFPCAARSLGQPASQKKSARQNNTAIKRNNTLEKCPGD
jgi:hypothetical protein